VNSDKSHSKSTRKKIWIWTLVKRTKEKKRVTGKRAVKTITKGCGRQGIFRIMEKRNIRKDHERQRGRREGPTGKSSMKASREKNSQRQ